MNPTNTFSVTDTVSTFQDWFAWYAEKEDLWMYLVKDEGDTCLMLGTPEGWIQSKISVDGLKKLTVVVTAENDSNSLAIYKKAFMQKLVETWPVRERRPEGRKPIPVNDWAYQEYIKGRSIDDILPEYTERRADDDLADPRESLKQAIMGRNAKK